MDWSYSKNDALKKDLFEESGPDLILADNINSGFLMLVLLTRYAMKLESTNIQKMLERIYAHTHSDKGPYGICRTLTERCATGPEGL
jgi:hypothetical protein